MNKIIKYILGTAGALTILGNASKAQDKNNQVFLEDTVDKELNADTANKELNVDIPNNDDFYNGMTLENYFDLKDIKEDSTRAVSNDTTVSDSASIDELYNRIEKLMQSEDKDEILERLNMDADQLKLYKDALQAIEEFHPELAEEGKNLADVNDTILGYIKKETDDVGVEDVVNLVEDRYEHKDFLKNYCDSTSTAGAKTDTLSPEKGLSAHGNTGVTGDGNFTYGGGFEYNVSNRVGLDINFIHQKAPSDYDDVLHSGEDNTELPNGDVVHTSQESRREADVYKNTLEISVPIDLIKSGDFSVDLAPSFRGKHYSASSEDITKHRHNGDLSTTTSNPIEDEAFSVTTGMDIGLETRIGNLTMKLGYDTPGYSLTGKPDLNIYESVTGPEGNKITPEFGNFDPGQLYFQIGYNLTGGE